MKKRVLSVMVIVSLLPFFIQDDYALAKESESMELESQEAEEIAEGFMTESNGGLEEGLEKDVIPMYDEGDHISAYMITFEKKG